MRALEILSDQARRVALALAEVARMGPIRAVGHGDRAVGMTLLNLLGIEHSVSAKPTFHGLVITARRGNRFRDSNRVNLFAKVPDWNLSACKSSREIVNRYGYPRDGGLKLYATIRARQSNAQGLLLTVDNAAGLLREMHRDEMGETQVAAWKLSVLEQRLLSTHPESAWVMAISTKRAGEEYFHYRYVQFTHAPRASELASLLEQGTVTVDHLIFSKDGRTTEKGPLFKIKPANVCALFPESARFDLMSL